MTVRTRRGFLTADALAAGYIEQRGWLSPNGKVANVVELRQAPGPAGFNYRVIHTVGDPGDTAPLILSDKTYTSLTDARRQLMEAGTR